MITISRITSITALGLVLPGCTQLEKLDDGSGPASIPTDVQAAFDRSCAIGGCHDSASQQGGLDLSATAAPAIVGGSSTQSDLPLVELGNVQGSYLALKLLPSPPSGVQMPSGLMPGLDNAVILGWIAGAQLPGGDDGASTTDTPADTTPSEESTTGPAEPVLCGLADVAPGAPNPYDIGTNAGQIPPDIGEVLTNNCGCHEVDPGDLIMGVVSYAGMVHFSTIAEIRTSYMGTPVYTRMLDRLQLEANPMPPAYYCDVGDGTSIAAEDRQLLSDWLMAEAPDAATWMP